jgi:outer membrane usher protein
MPALLTRRFALSRGVDFPSIAVARWLRYAGVVCLLGTSLARPAVAASSASASASPAFANASPAAADPAAADPAAAAEAAERLLLEVRINGHSIGKIGEFTWRRNKLMARPSELRALGLQIPPSRAWDADALIQLSDLPGLSFNIDEKNQVLDITASNGVLLPTILLPEDQQAPGRRVIESGKGMTLNHDIIGTYAGGKASASGSFDLRAFSPWGVTSSGWLVNAGSASIGTSRNTAIRLDSAYSFADVNSLRRYSLGDFITGGLSWTRALRMEGVQIRSDFSMRPDLVTFPLPFISGSAAVPSTVNVLTDGNAAISHSVDAGPFEIPQLPVVSGAGTITMTVTNSLGQQVTLTQPFYASSTLLTPGLQTFAWQLGLVRRNWGSVSNDYGPLAATAVYRRGITRKLTIELGAEGTDGAGMAGGSSVLQVGNLGVFTFALSPSIAPGHFGAQYSVGAQRIGRVFSLGGSASFADRNYRDVASMNGAGIQRKQLSAFSSYSFRRFGSVGASYTELNQDAAPTMITVAGGFAQRTRVVTANYSVQIKRASFYATEFRNLRSTGNGSNGLQVGVIIPIGKYRSMSAAGGSDGSRQLQVQQSASQVGDWGYQAYVAGGNSTHEFAQGQYKAPVGLFTAGVDRNDGLTTLRLESLGAISLVDKALFASNEIYDSFAVVDTRPVENIRVYQENRYVGTTGKTGRVLVPDMRAFDLNHISIDPTDVPADVSLSSDKLTLRPQDRSGVVIKFPIHISHSALLKLVDQAGAFVPQGSVATLRATTVVVPVGYDGEAYLEDLSPHNELSVEYPDGKRCAVVFDYLPLRGDIPSIGPLQCLEKRP